ncbi:MAG TPA: hypothetical protein VGD18_03700 [Thiobacillaceae bacterium]
MALVDRDQRDVVERGQVGAQRQVGGDPGDVVGQCGDRGEQRAAVAEGGQM